MQSMKDIVLYKAFSELKAEASKSSFGVLWWVLEPILYMVVFYFVFTAIKDRGGIEFVQFLLLGLVPWKWFAASITQLSGSIRGNVGLMTQVYVPKWIFIYIAIIRTTFKFSIVLVLLFIFLLFSGLELDSNLLYLFPVLFVQFLVLLGFGALLASIVPIVPDLKIMLDNIMMMLFFMSGIFFDINNIAEGPKKDFLLLNPMITIIDSYRAVLLRQEAPDLNLLGVWMVVALIAFSIGMLIIKKMDRAYPRIIIR